MKLFKISREDDHYKAISLTHSKPSIAIPSRAKESLNDISLKLFKISREDDRYEAISLAHSKRSIAIPSGAKESLSNMA